LTTETVTINPLLNKRLEDIKSKISSKYTIKHLLATGDNVQTIVDYLTAMNTEINYSSSYGIATIGTLYRFPNIIRINSSKMSHEMILSNT
jgi:hypothetical protein